MVDEKKVPDHVQAKLKKMLAEVEEIRVEAYALLSPPAEGKVSFTVRNSAVFQDLLTDQERGQIACFVAKLENMVEFHPRIRVEGQICRLENFALAVHVLSELRPIIQNESDAVYFRNVANTFRRKLALKDPSRGTTVTAQRENGEDVTETFINMINGCVKALELLIKRSDFDYLYNGFLQHSDERFSKRFSQDWHSGSFNYVLMKNAVLCALVCDLLRPMIQQSGLFYPYFRLGPL